MLQIAFFYPGNFPIVFVASTYEHISIHIYSLSKCLNDRTLYLDKMRKKTPQNPKPNKKKVTTLLQSLNGIICLPNKILYFSPSLVSESPTQQGMNAIESALFAKRKPIVLFLQNYNLCLFFLTPQTLKKSALLLAIQCFCALIALLVCK